MIRGDVRIRAILLTLFLVAAIAAIVTFGPDRTNDDMALSPARPAAEETQVRRHFDWAVKQLRSGNFEIAVNGFRAVLEQAPTMPEAYVNKGFAHIELGQYAQALQAFQKTLDLRPTQVNAYWWLAVSLEGLCDIAGAMGAMRTYVHLAKPDDAYLKKANAALWEWEQQKNKAEAGDMAGAECAQVDEPAD